MKREDFRTTLKPDSKKDLKILSAIENKPMNVIIEEMIKAKKEGK